MSTYPWCLLMSLCRNLLAIFAGTIVGIITTPLPLGAVAVLGLGVSMLTKTLTFAEAFSAFANEIP
jgi:di/tricarboxylate transporter